MAKSRSVSDAVRRSDISFLGAVQVARGLSALFPDGFAGFQIEAVRVVHEPVENCVGYDCGAEIRVPLGDRELRGDHGRADAVSVLDDFKQVPSLLLVER